jgi:hypothetical protein
MTTCASLVNEEGGCGCGSFLSSVYYIGWLDAALN